MILWNEDFVSCAQEDEEKPEDCIPDAPGNEDAREFLAHAPTKGLWMPLGREVKVMQCEWSHSLCPGAAYKETWLDVEKVPSSTQTSFHFHWDIQGECAWKPAHEQIYASGFLWPCCSAALE